MERKQRRKKKKRRSPCCHPGLYLYSVFGFDLCFSLGIFMRCRINAAWQLASGYMMVNDFVGLVSLYIC